MRKFVKIMTLVMVIVMSLALLVSCGPNRDPDKALSALEDNHYLAMKYPGVPEELADVKGIDTVISALKIIDGKADGVLILYFESSKAANDAWDKVNEYANNENEIYDHSDWTINKSGAMIYYGTDAAIKAAR